MGAHEAKARQRHPPDEKHPSAVVEEQARRDIDGSTAEAREAAGAAEAAQKVEGPATASLIVDRLCSPAAS